MLAACPPHITATGGQQRLRASLHRAAGGSRLSLRRSEGPVQALVTAAHPCPQAPAGELHHLHQQLQHQLHHQVDKAKNPIPSLTAQPSVKILQLSFSEHYPQWGFPTNTYNATLNIERDPKESDI